MSDIKYISPEVEKLVNDLADYIIEDYYRKTVKKIACITPWEVAVKDGTVFRFSKEHFENDGEEVNK